MASRVRRTPRTSEIWPGFVDALSALLMVIIFLLVVFMLAQYFLGVALSGRDEALDRLTRRVNELSDLLSLERQANAELRLDIAQLSSELQGSTASRDELSAQLSIVLAERNELSARLTRARDERDELSTRLTSARDERDELSARLTSVRDERDELSARLTSVLSENDALDLRLVEVTDRAQIAEAQAEALRAALAEAESTIVADRETVELKLAEIASLRQDLTALRKLRTDLEAQITQLAVVLDKSRAAVARLETESERQLERNRVLVVRLGETEEESERQLERNRVLVVRLGEIEEESERQLERNRVLVVRLGDAEEETESERERRRALELQLAEAEAESGQERESTRLVVIDLGKAETALEASRAEISRLSEEYTAVRDRTKRLEARLSDEAERTALAQSEIEERDIRLDELRLAVRQRDEDLIGQKALSARAQAQVELLNQQILALRQQLARIAKALDVAEAEAEEQKVVIANLGQKLNLALAGKVEELQRYRSEFFGRLREVLGDREGIEIVGDRFVFQSEVLFNSGSAVLEDEGAQQMGQLAKTLIEIAREIPDDLSWILRVDGHTDILPIQTQQFPSNWELSTARAISVVRYLISQGVPADNVAATGFGEFQPIDPRETEEAFRHNRRIELKLTNR